MYDTLDFVRLKSLIYIRHLESSRAKANVVSVGREYRIAQIHVGPMGRQVPLFSTRAKSYWPDYSNSDNLWQKIVGTPSLQGSKIVAPDKFLLQE